MHLIMQTIFYHDDLWEDKVGRQEVYDILLLLGMIICSFQVSSS